jgi:ubiquinone biosynthesis protein UbiJ
MGNPTEAFFAGLSSSGWIPMLARATGTVRFELLGEPAPQVWHIRIDRGETRVSRDDLDADCVVRVDSALFDEMASGRMNALAAMLRGVLTVEGDPELLVLVQRLFPGPSDTHAPLPFATVGGGRS